MMIRKVLFVALLLGSARAADYCAFHIAVDYSDGPTWRPNVPVEVIGAGGQVVAHTKTVDGKADVCDVGFGTFEIVVAPKSCGEVAVRRLTTTLGEDQAIRVVLNRCSGHSLFRPTACLVLLRAKNEEGAPIPQATVEIDAHPTRLRTDSLGRVVLAMDFDKTSAITVISEPRSPATVDVTCTKDDPEIERTLVLRGDQR